jgi:hypothetical protein
MANYTLDTVLNSVLTKSRGKLIMAIAKAHVLYAWASAKERIEFEDGGYELSNPMTVGRNPNIVTYQYYDHLPITQTNEFDTVKYTWTRVAASMMISDQEVDENKGSTKIFDLMAKKLEVLEESIKEKFSEWLYGSGAGTDPNGLGILIPSDPTTGTIGNKSRASNTWWRTSSYDFAGTLNAGNIEMAWDDIQMDLTVKSDSPDIIVCGRNIYRMYKQAVRDKIMIMKDAGPVSAKMSDLGFVGLQFGGIAMVFDEDCPINTAFWINSKYLRLHILRHVNMRPKELNAPWTQDVIGKRIVWQGNWCNWKAYRTHARVAA